MITSYLSITNLVSVAFLAYMGNSIFTLGKFWFPERCGEDLKVSSSSKKKQMLQQLQEVENEIRLL